MEIKSIWPPPPPRIYPYLGEEGEKSGEIFGNT